MKIHIMTTGGTIEGLEYNRLEDAPKNAPIKIEQFLTSAKVSFEFDVEPAFSKDSRFISEEDRKILLKKVKSTPTKHILITHGTLTMVDTAKYLGEHHLEKTIVLVGSFILGTSKNTDAPFNLGYAISALQTLQKGVYVAMNGTIFSWDEVSKNSELNRFESNV